MQCQLHRNLAFQGQFSTLHFCKANKATDQISETSGHTKLQIIISLDEMPLTTQSEDQCQDLSTTLWLLTAPGISTHSNQTTGIFLIDTQTL